MYIIIFILFFFKALKLLNNLLQLYNNYNNNNDNKDISLAVPISNSLTFVFTTIAGKFLGEPFGGASNII